MKTDINKVYLYLCSRENNKKPVFLWDSHETTKRFNFKTRFTSFELK